MTSLILPPTSKHTVVFTNKDLSVERVDHNCPVHITVKCRGLSVPTVLIDNGSAINVCPMRVAYRLGFTEKDFAPSNLTVKAYDGTRRMVEGTLVLKLDAEGFEMDVEFHVVDIPATFNLGRPWLHRSDIMAIPSTLHQKVMLGLPTGTLTICGDSRIRRLKEDRTPILGIMHGEEDVDLGGFSFDNSGSVLAINVDGDFLISSVAMDIMLRMSYFPGLGLGIRQQGVLEFPVFPSCQGRFGMGYTVSANNAKRRKHTEKPRTLYGDPDSYFVLKCYRFRKHTTIVGTVLSIPRPRDAPEDPTSLIVEAKGSLRNCIFKPRLTRIDDTSESESVSESESESSESSRSSFESEFVPLGPPRHSFYFEFDSLVLGNPKGSCEMNDSSSDYLHDLYINSVDPDNEGIDFDGDIPKEICALIEREDERHAQPLKEELKVIGDSNLVVSQANGDWKVREEKLKPYHQDLEDLIPHFNKVTFTHIPRLKNQFADALATLASMVELPFGVKLRPILIEQRDCPAYQYVSTIDDVDDGMP
ncbi:hypothetical protein RHMOL_Rhmol08G0153400 [Rhododendron molle]|uniref:Uncharacterized protein n=1 Tax=Rhododendron molle TaxID=49168 RepID=A0ACC0MP20_RHOML|nr:hypothetical protein RHMOL_Rhmol08G0153400 [Rhododendron molle]